MSFIKNWFTKKVEKCPHCNKYIPKEKFRDHKRKCKKKKNRELKEAKRERRKRRRRH